jgi:hypothetical protein
MNQTSLGFMYHIEKGDYVNKYWHYENNSIPTYIYKSLGLLCISLVVSYREGRVIYRACYLYWLVTY